ncbi:MAG: bifunctional riboflavin kinase/FAD synthetase [Flavobacteriaceae bacterium]|nr:bifunctional riboflavin kinase/FAD synthetase [Flavobacteriia bacterium]
MTVIHDITNYTSTKPAILTIGTFDGVHLGHQKIIQTLVVKAREKNCVANVLTFFPHPRMVLQKSNDLLLIDTLKEKEQFLKNLGIDHLIIQPFTTAFSTLSALAFTRDILVDRLHIASLYIGYDHRFGRNREASVEDLMGMGKTYGFEVEVIPAQEVDAVTVSSTKIRTAIAAGDFQKVTCYLGRDFEFSATVIHGDQVGRTLDFPTANLAVEASYKILPPKGVYLVKVAHLEKTYFGMMNVGNRPTVEGTHQTLEVHIFSFNQNLYGEELTVFVLKKIREEKKFDSLTALQTQLRIDQELCNKILNEKGLN